MYNDNKLVEYTIGTPLLVLQVQIALYRKSQRTPGEKLIRTIIVRVIGK